MSHLPVDEKTIGLTCKGGVIQAAYLIKKKGRFVIERLFEIPLLESNEDPVKPLYIDPEENILKELADQHLTVSAINESDVLVRRLRLKLTRDKDIEEAFLFQAEPELPYPLENAVVDKIIVEKSEGSSLLVFFSVKKDYVQKSIEFWQKHQIDPEIVSAEPIALNALLNASSSPHPLQYAIHVGRLATLSIIVKEGKLLAAHSIPTGWESIYQGYLLDKPQNLIEIEDIFSESFNLLETESLPHMKKALDELLQMILWNYLSLMKETRIKETPFLYITGEGANIFNLPPLIEAAIGIPQKELSFPGENCTKENFNRFALPIGLALSAQPSEAPIAINFRRNEFTFAAPWKRYKKPLLIYAMLALATACSLYLFGISYLKSKENELKNGFLNLLAFTQKPYDAFEALYEQKYPYERRGDGIVPIEFLDSKGISARIDFLESGIKSMPDTFPLLPNIPRVSDVLVWLSTHPKLVCQENAPPADCQPFMVDVFNYSLSKRPEITKKNERYQVKIDLEFSTSSPRLAREFHDALITPNDFVDPKGEIKWTATKGKYRTSFYLKDKTSYP